MTESTHDNMEEQSAEGSARSGRSRSIRVLQGLLALNLVLLGVVVAVATGLVSRPQMLQEQAPQGPLAEEPPTEEVDLLADPPERGLGRRRDSSGTAQSNSDERVARVAAGERDSQRTGGDTDRAVGAPALPDEESVAPAGTFSRDAWKRAERAYSAGQYAQAASLFRPLASRAKSIPSEHLTGDYFQLRQAQSLLKTGRTDESRKLLEYLQGCPSPVLRAMASYLLAREALAEKRYLACRTEAYRGVAALEAMDGKLALQADCLFLVGRSLTEKYQTFHTTDRRIAWPDSAGTDPFAELSRRELRDFLRDGRQRIQPRSLNATLRIQHDPMNPSRWEVSCQNATVREVINQFATQSGLDVQWHVKNTAAFRRPLDFHMRSVSSQMLSEVAAGMTGLIGRFTLDSILIYDPLAETSARAQSDLIRREASSAWRLFFLRHSQDHRVPTAHFALATLHAWSGESMAAINEYSLLAKRYDRSGEAPLALLASAKLKVNMMNYVGARQDLLDLLDLYPTYSQAGDVWLLLGNINENAGKFDDALDTYRNLYHRNLSESSRNMAALSAGRCYYRMKQYEDATKWFARFVATRPQPGSPEYVEAYFLLARSAAQSDQFDIAVQAFQRGLVGNPEKLARIPALLDLTGLMIRQEQYVQALGIVEKLQAENLWADAACRRAELHAEILRSIGLPDKARGAVRQAMNDLTDPSQQQSLKLELARCHIAARDDREARQVLTDLLPTLPDGPLADQATLLMAEICLRQDEPKQTITLARPLVTSQAPEPVKARARKLLGEAWLALQQYDKAALALSGEATQQQAKDATK